MPAIWQRLFDPDRVKLAPPLAWAIGAAAIMSVFAVVAIIVNYAPLNRDSERRVESDLPPASYDTIAALIKASGSSCARVCTVTAANALTVSNAVDVACALPDDTGGCRTPAHYRITVEAASGPAR